MYSTNELPDYQSPPVVRIDPRLDFTSDTAYVGVKIAPANEVVVTSDRRIIPWNEPDLLEHGILTAAHYPLLLEPRWSNESVRDFQNGAVSPDTTEIFHRIRATYKSIWACAARRNTT